MTADAERLAAIRVRLAAITPGPWLVEFPEHREDALIYAYNGDLHIADVGGLSTDAEFIADAPENIAYLLTVAAERDALIENVAASAIVDSPAFPDPRVANYVARWVRGFIDKDDYEVSTRGLVAVEEHDALRTRIEAAPHDVWVCLSVDEAANATGRPCTCWKSAALAGDQPEATPDPCQGDAKPAGNSTPEAPHLDPAPLVGSITGLRYAFDPDLIPFDFDPRPEFEQNRSAYEVQS